MDDHLLLRRRYAATGGTLLAVALAVGLATGGAVARHGGYESPGLGCGDRNHAHVGAPGNPQANPQCPPQAGKKK